MSGNLMRGAIYSRGFDAKLNSADNQIQEPRISQKYRCNKKRFGCTIRRNARAKNSPPSATSRSSLRLPDVGHGGQ